MEEREERAADQNSDASDTDHYAASIDAEPQQTSSLLDDVPQSIDGEIRQACHDDEVKDIEEQLQEDIQELAEDVAPKIQTETAFQPVMQTWASFPADAEQQATPIAADANPPYSNAPSLDQDQQRDSSLGAKLIHEPDTQDYSSPNYSPQDYFAPSPISDAADSTSDDSSTDKNLVSLSPPATEEDCDQGQSQEVAVASEDANQPFGANDHDPTEDDESGDSRGLAARRRTDSIGRFSSCESAVAARSEGRSIAIRA